MQYWKATEPKRKLGASAPRVPPQPGEGARSTAQEGWAQSTRFVRTAGQASTSASGRQFREFKSPDGPPPGLSNENTQTIATSTYSSDDEEDVIVYKTAANRSAPQATLRADENGWYDWDSNPSSSQQTDSKQSENFPSLAPEVQQCSETAIDANPQMQEFDYGILPDSAASPPVAEAVDTGFLEDFDSSLEAMQDRESPSGAPQFTLAASPDSGGSLTRSTSLVGACGSPSAALGQARKSDSDPIGANVKKHLCDPQGTQLEATTRTAGPSGLEARLPKPSVSRPSSVDGMFADAVEDTTDWAPDTSSSSVIQDNGSAVESDAQAIAILPAPLVEHSREQSQRLRLYSTLYADFARDPWKWHERRDIVREMFPSLQSEGSVGDQPPVSGEGDDGRDPGSQQFTYTADTESDACPDDSRSNAETGPGQRRVTSLIPPPDGTNASGRLMHNNLLPLEGQEYCRKCRRHFKNTWRMQRHLSSSPVHPYYCQGCTVDYSSFRELYMHYAENPNCRPPELEYGPAKPFLQILAEYQTTGRQEAARRRSASDAEAALRVQDGEGQYPRRPGNSYEPSKHTSSPSEPPTCPICMVPLMRAKEVLATACGHVYCSSCILHYSSKERPNCPKCRTPVSRATLVPLQLR